MTLSIAIVIGLAASALFPATRTVLPSFLPVRGGSDGPLAHGGRGLPGLFAHANAEYFDVIFFIVLGALFTAAAQTLVPRGDLTAVGSHRVWSVLAMMPLATLLSICSEADAFVARAFATTFSLGSVLAFMTIGQLVDLRNGLLLTRTVGKRVMLFIVLVSYALVFAQALAINALRPRL